LLPKTPKPHLLIFNSGSHVSDRKSLLLVL